MPKLKTHRGAAKRLTGTANGKLKRKHAFARHILTKKTTKRLRQLRKGGYVDGADLRQTRRLVPYL